MTGIQSLEARTALGSAFAIVGYFVASGKSIHRLDSRPFDGAINIAFILSRLAIFFGVFFVLHLPVRGDIPSFYVPEAHSLLQHQLPYRDFQSSYAPLHTFLDAALLRLWNSPLAIILFAILVEFLILPVWLRAARLFASERAVRIAAVLYITSAISLQFVTIDGQDNIVTALLLGLGVLAIAGQRDAISGALVGFSAVLVKFLSMLFAPAFILAARGWLRWLIGFVVIIVAGYGAFALLHLPILEPLSREGGLRTASDLPYLLESIAGYTAPMKLEDVLLGFVLLVIVAVMLRARLRARADAPLLRLAAFGCASLNLALLIFSKKSWPPYLVITLFPLCLVIGEGTRQRLRIACFALFNVVAVTTHSIWATIFSQFLAEPFHHALAQRQPMAIVFLITQILLVSGYAWLLIESIDAMLSPTPTSTRAASAAI
ncbi:MAG TPA: glycosyltransferase 87 family protein [Bryocella sp.]|nr:glycosyltransferase 87 family protein [Bryocella sp.]